MSEYLDSRDLYAELESLIDRRDDEEQEDPLDDDEETRLAQLEDLRDEMGETAMRDGETLIPESEFEDYARELAGEIGAGGGLEQPWPYTCIDWEQAASELAMDYTSVEFDGIDYLFRS